MSTANRNIRRALPLWIQAVVLGVVFLSGGIAGAMVTARVIYDRMETYRQQPPLFARDIATRLRFRLALSDSQGSRVQAIIERRHATMVEHQQESSQEMHVEFNAMVEEVSAVLDEKQKSRWQGIADHVRRTFLPPQAE